MKTVIVGSGATFGTLPQCPITREFGSALLARLAARGEDWQRKYPLLAEVVRDLWPEQRVSGSGWDLAHVWARLDYFAKFRALRRGGDYGPEASFQLHAAVLEVYGSQLFEEVTTRLDKGTPFTLLNIVAELRSGDALVSFNWDRVVEWVAERLPVVLVQAPGVADNSVQLIKPHGSVSWRHQLRKRLVEMTAVPMQPDDVTSEVEPFVIGAVPIKSELIWELQINHPGSPYTVLVGQWNSFMQALERADEVVVAGYSLPDEDAYGRFLIQEAIAGRRGRAIRRLYFYEQKNRETDMAKKLSEVFMPAEPPIPRGPVLPHA